MKRLHHSYKRWLLTVALASSSMSLTAAPGGYPRPVVATAAPAVELATEAAPPDVRIGDIRFRVDMQPFPDTYVGMTHFKTHTVQIDPASQADERRRVYLHELMHVAWHQGKPAVDKSRTYTEEEAIQALAPGLLKMLAENPQAVQYLTAPVK